MIIALLGTLVGLVIGLFFGWAVIEALKDQGFTSSRPPVGQLILVVIVGGFAGVLAAVFPARRCREARRPPGGHVRVTAERGYSNCLRTSSSFSRTASASSDWNVCIRRRSSGFVAARIRTASSPALRASPMPTVATGMPAGICTIDSSESRPSSLLAGDRHADDRQRRHRRRHPGQVGGAAGAGDDDLQPTIGGGARVLVEHVGRAVGGHDAYLERDSELGEHVDGGPHDREVGVAAHDHSDERASACTPS